MEQRQAGGHAGMAPCKRPLLTMLLHSAMPLAGGSLPKGARAHIPPARGRLRRALPVRDRAGHGRGLRL